MRFKIDHDLHIHTQLSIFSGHPEQTPKRILQHAKDNNLSTLCVAVVEAHTQINLLMSTSPSRCVGQSRTDAIDRQK